MLWSKHLFTTLGWEGPPSIMGMKSTLLVTALDVPLRNATLVKYPLHDGMISFDDMGCFGMTYPMSFLMLSSSSAMWASGSSIQSKCEVGPIPCFFMATWSKSACSGAGGLFRLLDTGRRCTTGLWVGSSRCIMIPVVQCVVPLPLRDGSLKLLSNAKQVKSWRIRRESWHFDQNAFEPKQNQSRWQMMNRRSD